MVEASRSGIIPVATISKALKLNARDTGALVVTLEIRGVVRRDGTTILRPGAQTPFEKSLDRAAAYLIGLEGEEANATDIDRITGKRGGVGELIDHLVAKGHRGDHFEDRTHDFPKARFARWSGSE